MATVKVISGFSKFRDDDLETKAQFIIDKMTNNAHYPNPVPNLSDVIHAKNEFTTALAEKETGGKEKTALKNQKRKALEVILGQLALYVQLNCQNDLAILLSSGFDARKPNEKVGILGKPENFKAEDGPNAGTVKLTIKSIENADSYLFECTETPITAESVWIGKASSKANYIFEDLTSGKQYAFRVSGIGSDPTPVYSEVVLRYVQ
jgi:hypothetical protein